MPAARQPVHPLIAAVVLNWNGSNDTLNAVESLLRSDYPQIRIVVCDNGSSDDSWAKFQRWSRGLLGPTHPKALPLSEILQNARLHDLRCQLVGDENDRRESLTDANVIIARRKSNDGYAAGVNSGVRIALDWGPSYIWLLNNDVIVKPDAARRLLEFCTDRPNVGLCGATVLNYDPPNAVQVLGGGHWNRYLAKPTPITDIREAESKLSYIQGAAVFASRTCIEAIGLPSEEYFLYCEEIDWAQRAAGRFGIAYCPEAVVYHKGGASTDYRGPQGQITLYHGIRSGLIVTRRFWPCLLPVALLSMLGRVLRRLAEGRPQHARTTLTAIRDYLIGRHPGNQWRL